MNKWKVVILMMGVLLCASISDAAVVWNISGGTENIGAGDFYDAVNIYNDASVGMMGGTVVNLWTYHTSDFLITDGTISGGIQMYGSSVITIEGGTVNSLVANDSVTVDIWGGDITEQLGIGLDAEVNYHVLDFTFDDYIGEQGGLFSGHWDNGTEFSIDFRTQESWERANIIIIPEPTTLTFSAFSFILLRRTFI